MEGDPKVITIKGPKPLCFKSYLQRVKISAIFCVIGYPIGCLTFVYLYFQFDGHPFSREWRIIQNGMLALAIFYGFYTIPFIILLIGTIKKIKWMLKLNIAFIAMAILFLIGFIINFFGFGIHFETGPLIGCILCGLFGISIAFGAIRDIYKALQEIGRELVETDEKLVNNRSKSKIIDVFSENLSKM